MKCIRCNHTGKGRFKVIVLFMIMAMVHAQALAAVVRINWNANAESDLSGYNVYYGTVPHVYTKAIDVGNFTSVEIDDLTPGQTYYMALTAYNASGESDLSDEQSITIPSDADVTQAIESDDGGSGGSGGGCFIATSGL